MFRQETVFRSIGKHFINEHPMVPKDLEKHCSLVWYILIEEMVIAITLRGFNIPGRLVTPIFLSMGHFLYRFSTFCEKVKKIYRVEV